jgi:hydrogenase nickel incorporation protein HypA/HybF
MHELSIALSLVEAASDEAARLGIQRVKALHVKVGRLSGVVREALEFSFDLAAADSAVAGARLAIEDVEVSVLCPLCGEERQLADPRHFHCPVCGTATGNVLHGRELELFAMEVEEDGTEDRRDPSGNPEEK